MTPVSLTPTAPKETSGLGRAVNRRRLGRLAWHAIVLSDAVKQYQARRPVLALHPFVCCCSEGRAVEQMRASQFPKGSPTGTIIQRLDHIIFLGMEEADKSLLSSIFHVQR
jgi:hypothetical protein